MNTALLLIDVQKGFEEPYWGERNNPNAENNMERLLDRWRKLERSVIHVQHCSTEEKSPLRAGTRGNEFQDCVMPVDGEKVFTKSVNSAFIGTELENYLKERGILTLVIAGLTTDHCVSTTTRMAGNLGFDVTLVSDATACFDRIGFDGKAYRAEEIHNIHLASLNDEFCVVKNTKEVLNTI